MSSMSGGKTPLRIPGASRSPSTAKKTPPPARPLPRPRTRTASSASMENSEEERSSAEGVDSPRLRPRAPSVGNGEGVIKRQAGKPEAPPPRARAQSVTSLDAIPVVRGGRTGAETKVGSPRPRARTVSGTTSGSASAENAAEPAAVGVSYELGSDTLSSIADLSFEVAEAILNGDRTAFAKAVVDAEMASMVGCEEEEEESSHNPAMSSAQAMLNALDKCEMSLRVAIRSRNRAKIANATKDVNAFCFHRFLQPQLDEARDLTLKLEAEASEAELAGSLNRLKAVLGSGDRRLLLNASAAVRAADATAGSAAAQTDDAGAWRQLRGEVAEVLAAANDEVSAVATLVSWVQAAVSGLPSAKGKDPNDRVDDKPESSVPVVVEGGDELKLRPTQAAAVAAAKKIRKAVMVTGAVGLTKGPAIEACAKLADLLAAFESSSSASSASGEGLEAAVTPSSLLDAMVEASGFLGQLEEGPKSVSKGVSGGEEAGGGAGGGEDSGAGGSGEGGRAESPLGPMQRAMQESWKDEEGNALGSSM